MEFWRKIFALTGEKNAENAHNFDPGLRYCPACGGEFRPEISRCPACGLELVTGEERIADWRRQRDERTRQNREIGAADMVTPALSGKLPDMKASGLVLAAVGIAYRITAVPQMAGCGG